MGKKKTVVLIDDVDGTTASESVEFGIDGQVYSLTLSSANAEALRSTLKGWAEHARRVTPPRRRHLARADPWRKQVTGKERTEIREWCQHNGYVVGSRGPLPFEAVDAFRSATARRR
ncbi:MAG: Lsr2 family protein [Actinomycetota bacterium]|nr:Lsr2 family protein [Actinomycetota bacterium]